jgi:hypothetical protein
MLVGRCFWELSGRKLHRKIKKSQTPTEAEGSAVLRTFPGNVFRQSVARWEGPAVSLPVLTDHVKSSLAPAF